jgi:hypothetical protein
MGTGRKTMEEAGRSERRRGMVESQALVYRVAADLALEHFGEESLIFLASTETFIKVNQAAGVLLDFIIDKFGRNAFSGEHLAGLLETCYHLKAAEAREKSLAVLADWTAHGIVVQ